MRLEESIKKLEEIVDKMQDETIDLDQSLALFEEGVKLVSQCSEMLKQHKGKLTILTEEMKKIVND